jgi:hypothetical protein
MFVRMLHPPNRDAIIHGLKQREVAQAKMIQSLPPEERMALITGKKAHGKQ